MKKLIPLLLLACTLPAAATVCTTDSWDRLNETYMYIASNANSLNKTNLTALGAMDDAAAACYDVVLSPNKLLSQMTDNELRWGYMLTYIRLRVLTEYVNRDKKAPSYSSDPNHIWK